MSQGEVVELLKKSKSPMSIREISEELGISTQSVNSNILRLVEHGTIDVYRMKKPMLFCWKEEE